MALNSGHCPGIYCGRTLFENGTLSDCAACPRGFRASLTSECLKCIESPTFYDWLYLGFMALLLLIIEWYLIDQTLKRRNFTVDVLALHTCAVFENSIAALATLLLVEPAGSFQINSCGVKKLADWYTLLHNPTPGYNRALRCTQEAVYPLYSMVFIHYALSLVLMLIFRIIVITRFLSGKGKKSVYLTMYVVPALIVLHAICGGLLYYSFPYIMIILSVISVAAHFAFRLDQSMRALFVTTFKDFRNLVILFGHWLLHTYGIIACTQLRNPLVHGLLIILVPFPALFYILTSRFTDPSKLHIE